MNFELISLVPISEAFDELSEPVCDAWEGHEEPSPHLVRKALLQLFALLEENNGADRSTSEQLKSEEVRELGEYGLSLLQEMSAYAADLGLKNISDDLEDLAFPFAVWLSRQSMEIKNITPVVNALARKASLVNDPLLLKQLYNYTTEIIDCVDPAIIQDLEKRNPSKPWHILLVNRAVIATRSQDLDLMRTAFNLLVEQLPNEASRFFEEGVEQMHIINYPEHVKELMQHYYLMYGTGHTIH